MKQLKLFFLCVAVMGCNLFAQDDAHVNSFQKKVDAMQQLLKSDPDPGYKQLELLLDEAIEKRDHFSELTLLSNKCWYFLRKADFQNVIHFAKKLEEKAVEYDNIKYRGVAHIYLSQVYIDNELYERALEEYEKAIQILDKANENDPKIIQSKANAHIYISNLYYKQEKFKMAIRKLLLADWELQKLPDSETKRSILFINYANIGTVYAKISPDSAEYYIRKSFTLQPENKEKGFTIFLNYSVLGDISQTRKDYLKALEYYKKAEQSRPEGGDPLNLEALYKGFVEVYDALGNKDASQQYQLKLKNVQLEISQHKNNSLHSVIKESGDENEKHRERNIIIISIAVFLCVGLLYLYFRQNRKYKLLKEGIDPLPLIEMIKKNDPGFMFAFEQTFTGFTKKLLQINPELSKTEIEFCSLLKLRLSTKEIARIKMMDPRSVHNSKYRIRKRLNIARKVDLYEWFSKL